MKRAIYLFFILIIFSCQREGRDDKLEIKEPLFNEDSNLESEAPIDVVAPEKKIETLINTDKEYPNLVVVDKADLNLDRDTSVEQLIILTDLKGLVTLSIADYNGATKSYTKAWDYTLPVIYNSDFSISEQDILGIQQDLQLVISGTTEDKSNALFIFQKSAAPKGLQIYYKRIFSEVNQGRIDIEEKERSLDYVEKRTNQGEAFGIITEKSKMLDENTLSITTEKWLWDRRKRVFIKSSVSTEEAKINAKERLTQIYRGNKKDFLNFLDGEWYLIKDDNSVDTVLVFDAKNERIFFSYGDGIEIFNFRYFWSSYRTMDITLRSNEVNTLPARIRLTLDDTDAITIVERAKYTKAFFGNYKRLTKEIKRDLISDTNTSIKQASPFTGVYKNVLYSINFTYPNYKKLSPTQGLIEEGVYNILKLSNGVEILQMKSMESVVTNYRLKYDEQVLESQIIRTIRIHQGRLTNYGIEVSPDNELIKFEQTEVLSNE